MPLGTVIRLVLLLILFGGGTSALAVRPHPEQNLYNRDFRQVMSGARTYDPVAGMWLSYDPVWNAKDPNYLTFSGDDPINSFDSDGRLTAGFYAGLTGGNVPADASSAFMNGYYGGGITGTVGGQIGNEIQAANSPLTYINGALSYANNVSSYYDSDGILAAGSYALTSWNVGAIYSGVENYDLTYNNAGQSLGDGFQQAEAISSGVAATAGIAAGGLGLWNAATAPAATAPATAADNSLVTVTHYTDEAGMQAISQSGTVGTPTLQPFVTLPSEIPAGSTAADVEQILEIQPGRGQYSISFQTPASNLQIPANGTFTSGGAQQFQLINPEPINPANFVPTPTTPAP